MWKIFSGIAIAMLAGTAFLGYQNREEFLSEVKKFETAQSNREKTEAKLATTTDNLKNTNGTITDVETEIEGIESDLQITVAKTTEVEAEDRKVSETLESKLGEIAKLEEVKQKIGDLEEVQKEVARLEADIEAADQSILSAQNALKISQDKIKQQQQSIATKMELKRNQQNGIMPEGTRASVSQVYGSYGFVVIDGGDRQGFVPKAKLRVARHGNQIGTLTVTAVEPGYSVANIDKESFAAGETIVPGDVVTPAPKEQPVEAQEG